MSYYSRRKRYESTNGAPARDPASVPVDQWCQWQISRLVPVVKAGGFHQESLAHGAVRINGEFVCEVQWARILKVVEA